MVFLGRLEIPDFVSNLTRLQTFFVKLNLTHDT